MDPWDARKYFIRAVFRWWRERCTDMDVFRGSAFDEDSGYGQSYDDLMRDINATWQLAHTPLDPTPFVSLIAKAVHCSCRRGLMEAAMICCDYLPQRSQRTHRLCALCVLCGSLYFIAGAILWECRLPL